MNAASSTHTSPTYAIWRLWDDLFRSGRIADLTPAEALVLQGLTHHMRTDDWVTWVSVDRLTEILPIARCSVQRALRSLTRRGLIQVEARPGRSSVIGLHRELLAKLSQEGPHGEAPRGSIQAPKTRDRGLMVRPEQSKQIQNLVEQQTEPPAPVAVSSIELPDDLVQFAESDKTISKATVAKMIDRHGVDRIRLAVEFIQAQYDKRGIRVLNRGGLFRSTVENGYQTPIQIKEQVQAEKAVVIEKHRPEPGASWGRSPGGEIVTVIYVMPDCVHIQDAKGVARVVLNWAMDGWVWGQ